MKKAIDTIWERIHETYSFGEYPTEHVIRFVARNYYNERNRKNIKILDFGCGAGAHTWYLAREGFNTYAFDGSPSAVEKTKARLQQNGLEASLSVQDAVSIDYSENFFDAVIDNVCIYSNKMADINAMYRNIYRVLKRGGKLLSVCFGEKLDGYKTGKQVEDGTYVDIKEGILVNRGCSHLFTKFEIKQTLENNGFSDVQIDWCKYSDRGYLVHQYRCTAEKQKED